MTKKEQLLVKKLKEEMPEFTGSKSDIEKKIAMYIYLDRGKNKVFDERYFLGNNEDRKGIINEVEMDLEETRKSEKENGEADPVIEKRKTVCARMANEYRRLLNDFGISAKEIKTEENSDGIGEGDEHVEVLINFSNGQTISANPEDDLQNIQTGSKTTRFGKIYANGTETDESLSEDEIYELHKSCGYVKSKEDYMDEKIQKLAQRVKGYSASQILKEMVSDPEVNNYQKNIGYIEMYKFYVRVIGMIAGNFAQNGINYFNCYREKENKENGENERQYLMCIYSIENSKVNEIYLYSNSDRKFRLADLAGLQKLQSQGLHLGRNQNEKGKKILERELKKFQKSLPENR